MIVTRKEAEKKLGKELRGPQYVGKRWFLLSRSVPHRNLGGFATKQEAKDHERAVQYFKRNPTPVPEGVRDRQLWLRSREKVKRRVAVWPSAYASGQVTQEYKRAGGRYYNPSAPLTEESILELELAAIENPMTGLDKWFAEEWVDLARSVYLKGDKAGHLKPGGWVKCGRPDTTKGGYPKCRPLAEAKRMTPKQRLYAIRKKRKVEREAPKKQGRAPIMVKTYKKKSNPDQNPERKKLYIYPNKSAVKVAKRALERRKKLPKSKRGGLDAMEAHEQGIGSGVLRARDIAAGKRINAYQVKAFFDRHRSNFVKAKADGKKWEDSKAWQAWDLWGGEPLRKQVEAAVKKDKNERAKKNPPAKKKRVKKKIRKVERKLSKESHAMTKGAAIGTAVGGLAGSLVAPPAGGPIGAGAGAYTGAMIGKEMVNHDRKENPKRKKKKKSKEAKVRDWLAVHAHFRSGAGETKGPGGKSKARRSKEGARGSGQRRAIEENPYRGDDQLTKLRMEMYKLHEAGRGIREVVYDKKDQISGRKPRKTAGDFEFFKIYKSWSDMRYHISRVTNRGLDKKMVKALNEHAPIIHKGDMPAVYALLEDFSKSLDSNDYDTVIITLNATPGVKLSESKIPKHHASKKRGLRRLLSRNPYRDDKKRFKHEGILAERVLETWGEYEARKSGYIGPMAIEPRERFEHEGIPAMPKKAKKSKGPRDNPRSKLDAQANKYAAKIFRKLKDMGFFENDPSKRLPVPDGEFKIFDVKFKGKIIPLFLRVGYIDEYFHPGTAVYGSFTPSEYAPPNGILTIAVDRYIGDINKKAIEYAAIKLKETVRHELQHSAQKLPPASKRFKSAGVDFTKFTYGDPAEHFKFNFLDKNEIEAYTTGIYLEAKKRGLPFSDVLAETLRNIIDMYPPKVHPLIYKFGRKVLIKAHKRYNIKIPHKVTKRGERERRKKLVSKAKASAADMGGFDINNPLTPESGDIHSVALGEKAVSFVWDPEDTQVFQNESMQDFYYGNRKNAMRMVNLIEYIKSQGGGVIRTKEGKKAKILKRRMRDQGFKSYDFKKIYVYGPGFKRHAELLSLLHDLEESGKIQYAPGGRDQGWVDAIAHPVLGISRRGSRVTTDADKEKAFVFMEKTYFDDVADDIESNRLPLSKFKWKEREDGSVEFIRMNPKAKAQGNPEQTSKLKKSDKPPMAKDLIAKCRALWEAYCKRPGRVTLRKVEKHCETSMKASKFKTVKDERRRCMKVVRAEKKRLGM